MDQFWTEDTIEIYCALLGRAFFKIKALDDWGVFPCSVGVSSTGKSTTIECVSSAVGSVKTIDTNNNGFILQGADKCELLCIDEAENLPARLNIEIMKAMPRGEKITINGKYRETYDTCWDVPVLLSSNEIINYQDKSGAIAKRI
eukprot:6189127-Pleurochrysis_carterae.AAC.1